MRADIYLVEKGIVPSRQKAKTLIDEGKVYADGKAVTKCSQTLNNETIELRGELIPYVSRGGLKLKGAIDSFDIDVRDKVCLDVGASTGGFTDCLLQHGATKVYAVDCGHGQLDGKLLCDERVINIEGCNARDISNDIIPEAVDVCVLDVSFISQTLIHPVLSPLMKENAIFVTLIKPQFEVGRSNIGKKGIVKDEKAKRAAVDKVIESCNANSFELTGIIDSPIKGGDGNCEYLALFRYTKNN